MPNQNDLIPALRQTETSHLIARSKSDNMIIVPVIVTQTDQLNGRSIPKTFMDHVFNEEQVTGGHDRPYSVSPAFLEPLRSSSVVQSLSNASLSQSGDVGMDIDVDNIQSHPQPSSSTIEESTPMNHQNSPPNEEGLLHHSSTLLMLAGVSLEPPTTTTESERISYIENEYNPATFLGGDGSLLPKDEEGGTDAEFVSLQDIPLDEISPGPAGGDLYESDTDSYHSLSQDESDTITAGKGFVRPRRYRYRKILVPSKEAVQSLAGLLSNGRNEITYELEGCASVKSELFLWPEDVKIVVIDVEGAITVNRKSGVSVWTSFLGGSKSAVHDGVAKLLNNVYSNGYKILYISQNAASTKEQLEKIVAGTGSTLPPGPVIHSPECLMTGAVSSRSDVFKAAVLRGLKSLFPNISNPYYACFLTRPSDRVAFTRNGVPEGRIFVVDENTSELRSVNRTLRRSFDDINRFVNEMFPPIAGLSPSRY